MCKAVLFGFNGWSGKVCSGWFHSYGVELRAVLLLHHVLLLENLARGYPFAFSLQLPKARLMRVESIPRCPAAGLRPTPKPRLNSYLSSVAMTDAGRHLMQPQVLYQH